MAAEPAQFLAKAFAALSASRWSETIELCHQVLAIDSDTITVQKGSEKWQIARGAATVPADAKVGAKVVIMYTMAATEVTVKDDKAAKH